MNKNLRTIDNRFLTAPYDAEVTQNNPASGGKKVLSVGPKLLPIPTGNGTWTTNVSSAATALPFLGMNIAVYNNSSSAASITIGGSNVTSQAIGAVDTYGNVGIACPPNAWTYLSMSDFQYTISSSSSLIVYIIEDPTRIIQETGPYMQQNPPVYPYNG